MDPASRNWKWQARPRGGKVAAPQPSHAQPTALILPCFLEHSVLWRREKKPCRALMRNQPDALCHGPGWRRKEMHRPPGATRRCQSSPDATAASTLVWLQAALTDTCCFPAVWPPAARAWLAKAASTLDIGGWGCCQHRASCSRPSLGQVSVCHCPHQHGPGASRQTR